jgi:hypothetical protein
VFFESISPETTEASLEAYLLSKNYQIQHCNVHLELGKNKGYATVIFSDVTNVDKLMYNRPHTIDGVQVGVCRALRNQKCLKENIDVKNLIVSGIQNKLSKSDLYNYFEKYGKIYYVEMNNEDDFCQIVFDE